MPENVNYRCDWQHTKNVRESVYAHYRGRGVTSTTKLETLWWRWRATKGLRSPHA